MVDIITRTPYRMSLFGGGTDYPQWYREHGGAVLSSTIDKYCYLSLRYLPPFFAIRHRIVWSHIEVVNSIADILHPAVREGLLMMGFDDSCGLEIHHQGDLPARSGLGSSSSFSVGLILGLLALKRQVASPEELTRLAIELEQERLNEQGGSQDQTAVAFGGLNRIDFGTDGRIAVSPVKIAHDRKHALNKKILYFFVGTTRRSNQIAQSLVGNMSATAGQLHKMRSLVDQAQQVLEGDRDLDEIGSLLAETWQLKKQLSDKITNTEVDAIYASAVEAGALGGKLLGAGASGVMMFYVPMEKQSSVRAALAHLVEIDANFSDEGAHILLNRLEQTEGEPGG